MQTQQHHTPITMSQEDAEAAVDLLKNIQRTDGGNAVIYSGEHPSHGNVWIVIPPFGCSYLLLPLAPLDISS